MMGLVVRSLLRSRLPLPLLPLGSALVIRASHSGRVDWFGSDLQGVLAAIEYLAIIPMLSIVLATGWLRGEVGPWSWALARPITRTRWLGTTLLVDLATLAASVFVAYLVIGDLPDRWIGPWSGDGVRELGYLALLVIVHCGAALAGARGASAIGGGIHAATFTAVLLAMHALTIATVEITGAKLGRHSLSWWHLWREITSIGAPTRLGRAPLDQSLAIAPVMLIACATIILTLRACRALPARPRLSPVVVALAIVGVAVGLLATVVVVFTTPVRY